MLEHITAILVWAHPAAAYSSALLYNASNYRRLKRSILDQLWKADIKHFSEHWKWQCWQKFVSRLPWLNLCFLKALLRAMMLSCEGWHIWYTSQECYLLCCLDKLSLMDCNSVDKLIISRLGLTVQDQQQVTNFTVQEQHNFVYLISKNLAYADMRQLKIQAVQRLRVKVEFFAVQFFLAFLGCSNTPNSV